MKIKSAKLSRFFSVLPSRLFFLFIFLYFVFFGSHILFFQEKTSLFIFSSDFLAESIKQLGGFLVYLSGFLATFSYHPVTGALIYATILWMIVVFSLEITLAVSGSKKMLIPFLAGLALFYLQLDYRYLLFNNTGILLQILFFWLSIRYLKGFIPVLLVPLIYYLTGGFTWIYLVMFSAWLLTQRPEVWLLKIISLWLVILLFFWLSKEFLFFQSAGTLLKYPFTESDTGSQIYIFSAAVIMIAFLPILSAAGKKNPVRTEIFRIPAVIAGSALLFILLSVIAVLKYDKKISRYFRVENLFYQGRYQDVIDYNIRYPSGNILTLFLNNIALCETGRLNDMLFHFRQSPDGGTLFLKWDISGEISRRGGYFYYTIGMMNEARRWAFENMVTRGMTPEGLRLLIRADIINGDYKTAAKYINILKNTLFYRKEAKEYEKLLFDDKAVDLHPELGERRRNRVQTDFITISGDPLINVERILATGSMNRKVFEYRLAWLLLTKNYPGISHEWNKLGEYGFEKVPVHIDEAATAIKILYGGQFAPQGNLTVNPDTEIRFEKFLQIFQAYGNNLKTARPALEKQFGNTFWYWTFYH